MKEKKICHSCTLEKTDLNKLIILYNRKDKGYYFLLK